MDPDSNSNSNSGNDGGTLKKKKSFFKVPFQLRGHPPPPPRPVISRPIPISSSCILVTPALSAPPPAVPNTPPTQEGLARRGRRIPNAEEATPGEGQDAAADMTIRRRIEEGVARRRATSDTSPSPSPRRHQLRNEDATSPTPIPRRLPSDDAAPPPIPIRSQLRNKAGTAPALATRQFSNEYVPNPAPTTGQLPSYTGYGTLPHHTRGHQPNEMTTNLTPAPRQLSQGYAPPPSAVNSHELPVANPARPDYTIRPAPAFNRPMPKGYFPMPNGEKLVWQREPPRHKEMEQDPRWGMWLKEASERLENEPFLEEWGGRKKDGDKDGKKERKE